MSAASIAATPPPHHRTARAVFGTLAGLALGVGAVALGAVWGAPTLQAAANPAPSGVVPASAAPDTIRLGEGSVLAGQSSDVEMFWTLDRVDQVADTYTQRWDDAGLATGVEPTPEGLAVRALDTRNGLMRLANVIDNGDQRLVITSVTDMRTPLNTDADDAPVPVPENAAALQGQSTDDGGGLHYRASFVSPNKPGTVLRFYEQELTAEGYARQSGGVSRGDADARWTRGDEEVLLVAHDARRMGGEAGCFVTVDHVRRLHPSAPPPVDTQGSRQ